MEVYLVRHGIAEDGAGKPDEDRALTSEGEKKTKRALRGLRKLGVRRLDLVFSSPLVRAWETGKLVARALGADGPRVERGLAPGGDPRAVLERLSEETPEARVGLVGHQPDPGRLATWLAVGSGRGLPLGKAGVARIDFAEKPEAAQGDLVWLLTPEVLRRLAR
ncbi:phosphohistidine phosphatase SixA [bacterium]|nr:phosphohistidine phosphatase SixA [bacterium]